MEQLLRYYVITATILTLGELYQGPPSPLNPMGPNCAMMMATKRRPQNTAAYNYLSNFVPGMKPDYKDRDCITYDDINEVMQEAKSKIGDLPAANFELSSVYPEPEHLAVAAEILLEATRCLAQRFSLGKGALLHALPAVDMTRVASDMCPSLLRPDVKCEMSRYRTLTGMCNNLEHPSWGSARSVFARYLPPDYSDGINEPRNARDGSDLPNPRVVSFMTHHDMSVRDQRHNILLVFWGQMIDHDMTLAAGTLDTERNDIECCKYAPADQHPNCMNIPVPSDDPFYKFYNRRCLDFARIWPGPKEGCPLGPRSQINTVSSFLDANFVYGSNQDVATRLREFRGGRLKISTVHRELGLKELLPMKTVEKDVGCLARPRNVYCFDAGDERVNEQLMLTVMHTLWMRQHNNIAGELARINPAWSDETLYQETRHIVAALVQHLTYNEWLAPVIGWAAMRRYDLQPLTTGYYDSYNPKVNAAIRNAFQSAAFRFGHSLLPDVVTRYNKFGERIETMRVASVLRQPYNLYRPGVVDSFILGLMNQEANKMDPEVTTEVTNHLFERPGSGFGMDLAAINLQRARENGVPSYNRFREFCGLPPFRSFHDMMGMGVMQNKTVFRYSHMYRHSDDVDLWSAGISEHPAEGGGLLGPTFSCLIGLQFSHLRRGDRFWYENPGWPSSFTPDQLQEIRKMSVARLICDNSDDIPRVQANPFQLPDPISNPEMDCDLFPRMDFTKWRDVRFTK